MSYFNEDQRGVESWETEKLREIAALRTRLALADELLAAAEDMPHHRTDVPHYGKCDCNCCSANDRFTAAKKAYRASATLEIK